MGLLSLTAGRRAGGRRAHKRRDVRDPREYTLEQAPAAEAAAAVQARHSGLPASMSTLTAYTTVFDHRCLAMYGRCMQNPHYRATRSVTYGPARL